MPVFAFDKACLYHDGNKASIVKATLPMTTSVAAGTSPRAGRYIRQPSGYKAFVPAPLPPDPPIRIEGELQSLLSEADRALGRLDGSIQTLPNPDLFVLMYVKKEARKVRSTTCSPRKPTCSGIATSLATSTRWSTTSRR